MFFVIGQIKNKSKILKSRIESTSFILSQIK